ncbi:glycosyltransferase [Methylobacterium planeticum]|uniref:glycosyltransferase n=1 Tax=Methylobacterium planeticum TaxID=2615211 RepID=UPI001FEEA355|nr:glycosyltransferase [Methylobacterium planeticum]
MTRPPDDPPADATAVPRPAHGVADWPGPREGFTVPRPGTLPDGGPWPRVRVLTPIDGDVPGLSDTVASVLAQGYAEARHDVVPAGPRAEAALAAALDDPETGYLLFLRAGDLLAPGALVALCLEAALSGAAAVAGLRVLFDRAVTGLDVPALSGPDAGLPFTGGEMLFARAAIVRAGGLAPGRSPAELWTRLAEGAPAGGGRVRIGRPVLLQRAPGAAPAPPGLSVVSLTGAGYEGGAGIGQRRLADALALSGHRVSHLRLTDESPAAAAEWTDRFPRTEAAILSGRHDLVIAGNLHGATRSLDILGRLCAGLPVAQVLHDLFPLTGRCAYPNDCPRIVTGCDAGCPTPDQYPELARARVGPVHAAKRRLLAGLRAPLLLANSAWTAERARTYAPPGADIAEITLAFPSGVFRPAGRGALRRRLGLPEEDCLILFSAVIVDAPDKGFADLVSALRGVAGPGIGFVGIGRLDDPGALGLPNLFAPGLVAEEAELAAWYGACDLHVTASRAETLGQTPVEAGLCGTPTLAYAATGLTTAVIDGVSGRLVAPEPGALARALAELIADAPARRRLGAFARIALENRFSDAAAALTLHAVLAGRGLLPDPQARPRFTPAMLGRFAFAAERYPGATGTVQPPSSALVSRLRRAKKAVFGRNLPPWLRWARFGAARLRGALSRGLDGSPRAAGTGR